MPQEQWSPERERQYERIKASYEDRGENERALEIGARIFSVYGTPDARLWVITEADRSSTTILRPEEY